MKSLVTKVLLATTAVANGATQYTSSMSFRRGVGFLGLLVKTDASITVTQQCSVDDSTWYDPIDQNALALGTVSAAQTADKYIQPSPVIAPFIRYKIVAGAAANVSVSVVLQEE